VSAVAKQVVVKRVRTACSIDPSFQADPYYRGIWPPACLPNLGSLLLAPPSATNAPSALCPPGAFARWPREHRISLERQPK
jgi:hypothetical protein